MLVEVQNQISHSDAALQPSSRALKAQIVKYFFEAFREDLERQKSVDLTREFFEALDLAQLSASSDEEQQRMALNLISLLIHNNKGLSLQDIVSFDLQARDNYYKF